MFWSPKLQGQVLQRVILALWESTSQTRLKQSSDWSLQGTAIFQMSQPMVSLTIRQSSVGVSVKLSTGGTSPDRRNSQMQTVCTCVCDTSLPLTHSIIRGGVLVRRGQRAAGGAGGDERPAERRQVARGASRAEREGGVAARRRLPRLHAESPGRRAHPSPAQQPIIRG